MVLWEILLVVITIGRALYKKVNNVFDEKVQNGLIQSSIQNLALSWEKVTTYNFGLDASFLNQRLTLEADFYLRKTSDILTNSIIYKTMGSISAPMLQYCQSD